MYRVAIESARRLKRADALNDSTVLKRRTNQVEATVDDIHEVIILRY